jgi:hypothetical protein
MQSPRRKFLEADSAGNFDIGVGKDLGSKKLS